MTAEEAATLNILTALIEDMASRDPNLKSRLRGSIASRMTDVPDMLKSEQMKIILSRLQD